MLEIQDFVVMNDLIEHVGEPRREPLPDVGAYLTYMQALSYDTGVRCACLEQTLANTGDGCPYELWKFDKTSPAGKGLQGGAHITYRGIRVITEDSITEP